ncbi:MAG: polysaccharide deacetylase family protein, partial [Candidatus Omnitrophica bacterium]|nr:polysaccharide deacetylase family protein [Candidatus Omnitrophota bacterium]
MTNINNDVIKVLTRAVKDGVSFLIYLFVMMRRRKGTVTLVYHSIGRVDTSKDIYRLNITPERFEEHLKIISRMKEGVRITFDDGYGNNFENAFPLMIKYGCKAAIFIITDFIDGRIGSDRLCGEGLGLRPLTWEEIKTMDKSGIAFGSHTKTHPVLSGLSRE